MEVGSSHIHFPDLPWKAGLDAEYCARCTAKHGPPSVGGFGGHVRTQAEVDARQRDALGMTVAELEVVKEAAAGLEDVPDDIGALEWVFLGHDERTCCQPLDFRIPLTHRLPFPALKQTRFGWDPQRRIVAYRVEGQSRRRIPWPSGGSRHRLPRDFTSGPHEPVGSSTGVPYAEKEDVE